MLTYRKSPPTAGTSATTLFGISAGHYLHRVVQNSLESVDRLFVGGENAQLLELAPGDAFDFGAGPVEGIYLKGTNATDFGILNLE